MIKKTLHDIGLDDLAWLEKKLREEFDQPKEVHQWDQYWQTIERARRFGFDALAAEMESDMAVTNPGKE